jgi:hypothetical protein
MKVVVEVFPEDGMWITGRWRIGPRRTFFARVLGLAIFVRVTPRWRP